MKYTVCPNCGNNVPHNEFLLGAGKKARCPHCESELNPSTKKDDERKKRWSERITNDDIKDLFF